MRRQIVITLLGILLTTSVFAQKPALLAGNKLIGGSVWLNANNNSLNWKGWMNRFSGGISPKIGFFVTRQVCLGGEASISFEKQTPFFRGNKGLISTTYFGPFLRLYAKKGFFGEFSFGIGSLLGENYSLLIYNTGGGVITEAEYNHVATNFQVSIGYDIFLNDRIAIEPELIYYGVVWNEIGGPKGPEFSRSGITFSIGIQGFHGPGLKSQARQKEKRNKTVAPQD